MVNCDVLVIGGGPGGSSCAWRLVRAGLDVVVMDRAAFPRDKPCAGWVTPAVFTELRIDLDEYRSGRVLEPLTAFSTGMQGASEVETRYGEPISYGIRRCEFDHFLLQRAGARLRLAEPLRTLERTSDGAWLANGQVRAGVVVGAGGHFCPVARVLGARVGRGELAVAAQEIEVELRQDQLRACPIRPGVPYLYFCPDLKGYGWYYRKGNFLNVGLGREGDDRLAEQVEAFCDWLARRGKIPPDLTSRFRGHAYLVYPHARRRVVDDGVLLVGDAAGLAFAPSGEGIRPAVESGLMAADVILHANGDYRLDRLAGYQDRLAARFGQRPGNDWSERIPDWLKRFALAGLLRSRWFSRRVLVERWFLRTHEPPLASPDDAMRSNPRGLECTLG